MPSAIRAKLARAREHAGELEHVFQKYVSGDNFSLRHDFYVDSGWNKLCYDVTNEPPQRLALLLGDMASNAIGALDYLVWQLVRQAGRVPPGRHNSFPIVRDENNWTGAAGSQLKGVDPQWIDVVRDVQPHHEADPDMHLLSALDDMNRICKHRLPPTSIQTAHYIEMSDLGVSGGTEYQFDFVNAPLAQDAVVFQIRSDARERMDFPNIDAVFRIGFEDGTQRQWDNAAALDWVESTIDKFEGAFV